MAAKINARPYITLAEPTPALQSLSKNKKPAKEREAGPRIPPHREDTGTELLAKFPAYGCSEKKAGHIHTTCTEEQRSRVHVTTLY